jgi:hypothetical protein
VAILLLLLLLLVSLRGWLLGYRGTPDGGIGLELGQVVGLLVCFVASALRLRLHSLLHGHAGMMQRLLFHEGVTDLGGLAGEVKVPASLASRGHAVAEGIIVEGISGLVQLVPKAVVGLLEVQGVIGVGGVAQACEGIMLLEDTTRALLVAR